MAAGQLGARAAKLVALVHRLALAPVRLRPMAARFALE